MECPLHSSVLITTGFSIVLGIVIPGNNSTITQLTQLEQEHLPIEVRGDDFAECDVEIQNEDVEFEKNMSLTVFKRGDLITFRESDGYCFNIIELTNDIDFKKMTPRSKVKGNILILHSEDEEDTVIFQREDQCKGGDTQFAHILRN